MDRIWQWAWDRYGSRYSWAVYVVSVPFLIQPYLVTSFLVVAMERSGRYVEAAVVAVFGPLVAMYVMVLPGLCQLRRDLASTRCPRQR
jgi:adenylate cyclase